MSFTISKEDLQDQEELGKKLFDLSSIVFRKHFYVNNDEKEDLISIGILKALSLIKAGSWKEEKGSILNYLYSGIRNEMHNYIYHQKREICYEHMENERVVDSYFEEECFNIDSRVVIEVCNQFSWCKEIQNQVVGELENRGFTITGEKLRINTETSNGGEFLQDLVDRLCGAILWKSLEYLH